MFHIFGIDGVLYNVPLESLRKDEEVSKLDKSYTARKIINREADKEGREGDGEKLSDAVKAYKDAVKITRDREPILHAYSIMKSPVLTLDPGLKITEAWNLFQKKGVSHMPVLSNEKKIIGIVSDRDILRSLADNNDKTDISTEKIVSGIMTKKVITAGRLTDIRRIAKAMFEQHIGTMPIVDDAEQLLGIITRSDILYALINYPPLSLWA